MWMVPCSFAARIWLASLPIATLAASESAALFLGNARSDLSVTVGLSGVLVTTGSVLVGDGDALGFLVGLFLSPWPVVCAGFFGFASASGEVPPCVNHQVPPAIAPTRSTTRGTTSLARLRGGSSSSISSGGAARQVCWATGSVSATGTGAGSGGGGGANSRGATGLVPSS